MEMDNKYLCFHWKPLQKGSWIILFDKYWRVSRKWKNFFGKCSTIMFTVFCFLCLIENGEKTIFFLTEANSKFKVSRLLFQMKRLFKFYKSLLPIHRRRICMMPVGKRISRTSMECFLQKPHQNSFRTKEMRTPMNTKFDISSERLIFFRIVFCVWIQTNVLNIEKHHDFPCLPYNTILHKSFKSLILEHGNINGF